MRRGVLARLLRRHFSEPGEPASDADLLARYTSSRDEAAFELLVWRHAVLVAGICRRIVRDEHLAEDAFQAAFLILARKAGSIRGTNLAGWLFRVARRVAIRARHKAELQSKRESVLIDDPARESHPHSIERSETSAILDEEVARLPERFRLPVLLCYLGGSTTEEAARLLGCPRGTILSRLATARERLAIRLSLRGVTLPAGGLVAMIVLPTESAVASLVPTAARQAIAFHLGLPSSHSSTILAEGALRTMKTSQLLGATATVAIIAVLVSGAGILVFQTGGRGNHAAAAGQPLPVQPAEPSGQQPVDREQTERAVDDKQLLYRKLEALSDRLKGELQSKERAIQLMMDANAPPGQPTRTLQSLANLEAEIAARESDILEQEAILAVLKKRKEARAYLPDEAELERQVTFDSRVQTLLVEKQRQELLLADAKKLTVEQTPTIVELHKKVDGFVKQLAELRDCARIELMNLAKNQGEESLRKRTAEAQDTLEIKKAVLAALSAKQKLLQKDVAGAARGDLSLLSLRADLEPLREALKQIERARMQLRIELDGVRLPAASDSKLDAVLKELQELRREVQQLRDQKKP